MTLALQLELGRSSYLSQEQNRQTGTKHAFQKRTPMLKMTYCLKRLPGLSRAEFHDHWLNKHAPLVKEHAHALGILKYVQSHSISDPDRFPAAAQRGSGGIDYDGVAQFWWKDWESFAAAGASEAAGVAGPILLADERKFIDLANSPIFLSEDREIIG